ncbi:uncharacterized protein BYT42DRAFT_612684 [Radiomyces spectabilis]|uniref:uncharacterized protein n=1 Tax=Radiomyces spectabilis TaxID=64574 RepID=UPI0022205CE3|nr:uncharacterized protein BYT42DRAFT_612684 [Radiomyces spectabilis]KAI8385033.1 hypothetical protein BYT42DRAFT_612684 [Radiomyces spectabilis]
MDDDFPSVINKRIISVIVKETGFQAIQPAALEALEDLFGSYLQKLLYNTHSYATLANHSKPNYHDITRALEELGVQNSDFQAYLDKYLAAPSLDASRKPIKTEKSQISTVEKIPEFLPSDDDEEDSADEKEGIPSYVPQHFPRFPSRHSFRQTPVYIQRPDDPQKVRELNSQQSRTVEENLKRLMAAENKIAFKSSTESVDSPSLMMPIVNYEVAMQRRKRVKQVDFASYSRKTSESPIATNDMKEQAKRQKV